MAYCSIGGYTENRWCNYTGTNPPVIEMQSLSTGGFVLYKFLLFKITPL